MSELTGANGLKVVYDENLGHHRLDPYPERETVEAYYQTDQFYSGHSPQDWFEKEWEEYRAGLWNSYFQYLARLGENYKNTLDAKEILDYGCGPGWFIDYCCRNVKCYWIKGIDSSLSALEFGNEKLGTLPTRQTIDDFYGPLSRIDLIYLLLVLEHIVNPADFLRNLVNDHLHYGGRLVIVVPNDLNPLQRKLGYTGFISPVHVNYFTPQTLRNALTGAGLRVVYEAATFPMELFPLVGINYFGNDSLGRKCHRFRLKMEKLLGPKVFDFYKRLYDRWGIGRELIFVGEKV